MFWRRKRAKEPVKPPTVYRDRQGQEISREQRDALKQVDGYTEVARDQLSDNCVIVTLWTGVEGPDGSVYATLVLRDGTVTEQPPVCRRGASAGEDTDKQALTDHRSRVAVLKALIEKAHRV